MRPPRSRPVIVAVLAVAYPVLVFGLGAAAFVASALLTRDDDHGDFGDFDEAGALIFALAIALPVVVVVSHVAWAVLAARLLPQRRPAGIGAMVLLLALAAIGTCLFLGAGVGPVDPNGWTRLALVGVALASWAAVAATSLTRT